MTTTASFTINSDYLAYLKKIVHKLSLERNKDLSLSGMIREALEKLYPMPKK